MNSKREALRLRHRLAVRIVPAILRHEVSTSASAERANQQSVSIAPEQLRWFRCADHFVSVATDWRCDIETFAFHTPSCSMTSGGSTSTFTTRHAVTEYHRSASALAARAAWAAVSNRSPLPDHLPLESACTSYL